MSSPSWDKEFERKDYPFEMSLRYLWATQRQINRFTEGFVTRPDAYWDYARGIVVPNGTERTYALYRADGDLVVNLAWRTVLWLRRLDAELGSQPGTREPKPKLVEAIKILRNIYEHWDEQVEDFRAGTPTTRSGPKFRRANPTLDWPGDGWKASRSEGVVMDNLGLKELFEDLSRIESRLMQERQALWASIGLTRLDGDYKPMRHWTT